MSERGPSGTGHDTAASERVLNRVLLCPHRKDCLDNGCAGCCEQDPPLCRDGSNVTHRAAPDPPVAVPGPASVSPAEPLADLTAEELVALGHGLRMVPENVMVGHEFLWQSEAFKALWEKVAHAINTRDDVAPFRKGVESA